MRICVLATFVYCSMAVIASEKVEELRKFISEHGQIDLSTEEGDKIYNEIEARKNALTEDEKREFDQLEMSESMVQLQKAMKELLEVPIDTPAAVVDTFVDEDMSSDSVFGVKFGTKVEKQPLGVGRAGPLALLANETKLKIPKPVKWFTTVSGQPDFRNKRIYHLTFRAAIPETMSQVEVDKGVRQLGELMKTKFGANCMDDDDWSREFLVGIFDSKKSKRPIDMANALASVVPDLNVPRTITLSVENRRIAKLDPEIPRPNDGDGFADDLKIPQGLKLEEPDIQEEDNIDDSLPKPKKSGTPQTTDFKLINGMQGGIYHYLATVNPGEDGEVYLRAYEVTKGTRLSAERIKQCTIEKVVGAGEKIIGIGKEFKIYEGDWDKYYAARIEIWFIPANGGKPRKLKEKLFRVQGWMF